MTSAGGFEASLSSFSSDEELVVAFQQGHRDAFELIDGRYRERLGSFLARRGVDHEESLDIVQQTLFYASQKMEQLRDGRALAVWLYRTALRVWVDEYRKNCPGSRSGRSGPRFVSLSTVPIELIPSNGLKDDPGLQVALRDEVENIWILARRHLTATEFELLWLKYVDEMDDADIAAIQKRACGALRTALHRVRRKLIDILRTEKVLE